MKKMTSIFRTLHKAYSVALVGIAALAVAGCSIKDDEFNMINEENSKLYTIDHTNEDADQVHRGYKSTNYAHAGGLVNIHFDSISTGTYGDGVMGLIFGLDGSKNARNFYVIGIRNKKDYYVSQYKMSIIPTQMTINEALNKEQFDFAIAVNTNTYYEALMRGVPCMRFCDGSFELPAGYDDIFQTQDEYVSKLGKIKTMSLTDEYQAKINEILTYCIGVGVDNYKELIYG